MQVSRFPRFLKTVLLAGILLVMAGCRNRDLASAPLAFENDGMLLLDGKRHFIIGSYHLPKTKMPFQTLSFNGYNYVRVNSPAEMDSAHRNGLYSWVYTGTIQADEDKTRISSLVKQYRTHRGLLFWEIEDEPAFTWGSPKPRVTPDQMAEACSLIKSYDPIHPVITNHAPVNLISTLRQYNASTDIVACDVYPVIPQGIVPTYALYPDGLQGDLLNPYISQVGEYVDKMKKVVSNSKPVFMVLQGFAWEMLKPEEERDPAMILYPTYAQSRFMAYSAIIHGATGILYWGTRYTPQPSQFIDDLNRVTRELAEMHPVLAARTVELSINKEYHELMYSVDTGVEIMTKKVANMTYMLTANSDKNPVKVTLNGLSGFETVSVLTEHRKLQISDGKFTDRYEPFDVHIYQLQP